MSSVLKYRATECVKQDVLDGKSYRLARFLPLSIKTVDMGQLLGYTFFCRFRKGVVRMFWKMSESMALLLQPEGEEEKEIYTYGVWMLVTTLFDTMEVLLLGLLFHRVMESVIYLAVLMILRRYTGGYHASTFQRCNAMVLGCYAVTLFAESCFVCIGNRWIAGIVVGAVIAVIYRYAPIEHKNKPLTDVERIRYRRYSLLLSAGILALVLGLYDIYPNQMAYTAINMVMVGGMMLFEIFLRKRQGKWNQDGRM